MKKSIFFRVTWQALFQGHYIYNIYGKPCPQNPVSNILELLLINWIDFKPPFQNKVHGSLSYVFFLQPFTWYIYYTTPINPKFATESKCNHMYVSFSMGMILSDIWSRSNFWVTACFLSADVSKTIDSLTHFTDWIGHFCCKCWLQSLDLFEWFWWYLWPKMALEMSQEFWTVSLILPIKPRLGCH